MYNANPVSTIQLTKTSESTKGLQSGSNVFVRVLEKGINNEYVVSFSGNKVNVLSQKLLQVGTAFRALVTVKEGKIFLTPHISTGENNIQKISAADTNSLEKLSGFLHNLGMKADSISLRIVQYFQSAGVNFNLKLAIKARTIGMKFPGRETEASEVALFLEQRGIYADVDSVMGLLAVLYGDNSNHNQKNKNSDDTKQNDTLITEEETNDETFNIEKDDSAPTILESLYENVKVLQKNHGGLLTFVNHHCNNPQHWIILPFEQGSGDERVTGSIRLLLNFNKKSSEKMIIYAFSGGNNYKFVVKYTKGENLGQQRYEIKFCSDGKDTNKHSNQLSKMLEVCLPKDIAFDVSYEKELLHDGIFTMGSIISIVELDV